MGNIGFCKIWENNDQNFLESTLVAIYSSVTVFYLKQCYKAGGKLNALTRIQKFMSFERLGVLMKSFIESQFAYCPLVSMCCDKTSHSRINHLSERALKTVYNENLSTFEKRLEKDNSVTIYVRNLRTLTMELYKTKQNLAATMMHKISEQKNIQNNLRSQTGFQLELVNTINCGLRALRYFGPKNSGKLNALTRIQKFMSFERLGVLKNDENSRRKLNLGRLGIVLLYIYIYIYIFKKSIFV